MGEQNEENSLLLEGGVIMEIRDPIHGFIYLSEEEKKIIDTRAFQRLRRIHQLGTTYLTYPSAVHTRFAHSLGAMHVATLIFDKLIEKRKDILIEDQEWGKDGIKKYRQMLRLAALLHDIGHAPFSHASDELFDEPINKHEFMAAEIITKDEEIRDSIDRIGANYGFTASDIARLITGESFNAPERLLISIFASELDCDKMDYLLRDSLYTGTKYGTFDLDRILNTLTLIPDYEKGWVIGVEYDGVHAVEGLILARYYMFTQVYFHKTRRIYDIILEKVLKEMLKEKYGKEKLPTDIDQFLDLDDYQVIEYAKNSNSKWADRFVNRRHLKCIEDGSSMISTGDQHYHEIIKSELESRFGDGIIVDRTQKAPVRFEDESDPTILVVDKNLETYSFKQIAPVVAKLEEPIYVFRVYSEPNLENKIKEYIKMRLIRLKKEDS